MFDDRDRRGDRRRARRGAGRTGPAGRRVAEVDRAAALGAVEFGVGAMQVADDAFGVGPVGEAAEVGVAGRLQRGDAGGPAPFGDVATEPMSTNGVPPLKIRSPQNRVERSGNVSNGGSRVRQPQSRWSQKGNRRGAPNAIISARARSWATIVAASKSALPPGVVAVMVGVDHPPLPDHSTGGHLGRTYSGDVWNAM
jgi:hypothetical protein